MVISPPCMIIILDYIAVTASHPCLYKVANFVQFQSLGRQIPVICLLCSQFRELSLHTLVSL